MVLLTIDEKKKIFDSVSDEYQSETEEEKYRLYQAGVFLELFLKNQGREPEDMKELDTWIKNNISKEIDQELLFKF